MLWNTVSRYTDVGLLIFRIGFGREMLVFHGWKKLLEGPEAWSSVDQTMQIFGDLDYSYQNNHLFLFKTITCSYSKQSLIPIENNHFGDLYALLINACSYWFCWLTSLGELWRTGPDNLASCFLMDSPLSLTRCAICTSWSKIASDRVGFAITSCHDSI